MLTTIFDILRSLVLAVAYRFRGGGWIQTSDLFYRSVWAACLAVIFFSCSMIWEQAVWVLVGAYFSVQFIPHAFAQNMGRGTITWSEQGIKKYWPGAWLPQYTQDEYNILTTFDKTLFDFFGMMSVGVIRGLIVFGGAAAVSLFMGTDVMVALNHLVLAIAVLAIGCPLAYLILWYVPWTLPSLTGHSTEWPEFGIGLIWTAAILAYLS